MDVHKKYAIPTTQEEDLQQALMVLWVQLEQGVRERAVLEPVLRERVHPEILDRLLLEGYVSERAGALALSKEGRGIGRDMTRRHRLTERLLKDVLDLSKEQIDPNTCRMEHVITQDVEEAICTLLGHPPVCPHGLPIARGACCERAAAHTEPIVVPLPTLAAGQRGHIAYFVPRDRPELHKLLSLGVSPGAEVAITQVFPVLVVTIGETLVALDAAIAHQIFVRRTRGGSHPPRVGQ